MDFGVCVATNIDDWQLIRYAEELGFDSAWVPDSQMIWSDCYATLAVAAKETSRIRLGTGVAIPGTRIAPVTAHSIATISRIAPGRIFLGIGTGHTAMRVMGMPPMRIKPFREYIRVLKTLLRGGEVDYTYGGDTRTIRFLHQDLDFLNLSDPIPIIIAANGPRALKTAGELGDGWVSGTKPEAVPFLRDFTAVRDAADDARRSLPNNFHASAFTTAVVLQPGETLSSDRVIEMCGSQVTAIIHFVYEIYKQTGQSAVIPEGYHGIWDEYCAHVERMSTPEEKRYLELHNGHCTFLVPEERRFVTPDTIRTTCLVGEPEELVEQIKKAEEAGLKEVVLLPPMAAARNVFKDFSEMVMKRY